jgi:hypothetical protein
MSFDNQIFGTVSNIDNREQLSIYHMDGLKISFWTKKGWLMISVQTH